MQRKSLRFDINWQHISIHVMKIRLLKRYKPDKFTFDRLKGEYGIYAIRGPRGVPHSLSEELKK